METSGPPSVRHLRVVWPQGGGLLHRLSSWWSELWAFGILQARACLFGAVLLALILLTHWLYPQDAWLARYDLLFLSAAGLQTAFWTLGLETTRELMVIMVFHLVATALELFKTHPAIGSWHYPEASVFAVAGVPLFAGFMYSAVGSFIARSWRLLDLRLVNYPSRSQAAMVVALVYVNFFTHHFFWDARWLLAGATCYLFRNTWIEFRPLHVHRRMPLLLGWLLVACFIWLAENIATFAGVWHYPQQIGQWQPVGLSKLVAWNLLLLVSFSLVQWLHASSPSNPERIQSR